jgi:hypothetical protein
VKGSEKAVPEVVVNDTLRTEHGIYVTASCGKTSAMVGITEHGVQVICQNACHRVFCGAGRHFDTIAEAVAAYKKPEMKAVILAADQLNS